MPAQSEIHFQKARFLHTLATHAQTTDDKAYVARLAEKHTRLSRKG